MSGAVGVFDSGIGGLTVASAIKQHLPNHKLVYFGDTLHLPYGDKSSDNIKNYIKAISAFLFEQQCDHLVVACNSASSVLPLMKELPKFHSIINVIDPVVQDVLSDNSIRKVGVIGTKRTINSHVYRNQLTKRGNNLEVYELATPLLAPMIEEGFVEDSIAEQVIHEYLTELPEVDALILGCTHYPLIKKEIDNFYKGRVKLFDAPNVVVKELTSMLEPIVNSLQEDHFYVSELTSSFEKTAQLFFGNSITLEKRDLFHF